MTIETADMNILADRIWRAVDDRFGERIADQRQWILEYIGSDKVLELLESGRLESTVERLRLLVNTGKTAE